MNARVVVDRNARTATIVDLSVQRVRFPEMPDSQQSDFARTLERQIPRMNVAFGLDQLMTNLDVAAKESVAAQQLQSAPPRIIFTPTPATLVVIDGQPRLQPTTDQPELMRVVNTPFIILLDLNSKQYFLKAGPFWYAANDVTGPWNNVGAIPAKVLAEGNTLAAPTPGAAADPEAPAPVNPGQIIVVQEPTELISTDGRPTYTPLPGNDLLYVTNTQADIFLDVTTQQTYVLLSGRWYRSASLQNGPWEFAPADRLPAAFARIPADSPKAHVLASVAGTVVAMNAQLDAQVPVTAAVDRNAGQSLTVAYDGQPRFEAIADSPVSYAVNTPNAVLYVDHRYYCCHQAVWYEGLEAVGPWGVCVHVPGVIYTIPPSCPVYNVRYCYVYESTPDVVYCGYLPGYTGCYVYGPTVVYGTGYYYHGWYEREYYPRPYTYGFGVRYDSYVGDWGGGANYRYDHRWFVHDGDHHGWWGPRGFVDYHTLPRRDGIPESRYNLTNVNNHTTINNTTIVRNTYITKLNVYNRTDNVKRNVTVNRTAFIRGEGSHPNVSHPDMIRQQPSRIENQPMVRNPASPGENNIQVGRDGQVYRKTIQGWEQQSGKGWQKSAAPPDIRASESPAAHSGNPHVPARLDQPAPSPKPFERGTDHVPARVDRPADHQPIEHQPARIEKPAESPKTIPPREDRIPAREDRPAAHEPARVEREPARVEREPARVEPREERLPARVDRPIEPPARIDHQAEVPAHHETPPVHEPAPREPAPREPVPRDPAPREPVHREPPPPHSSGGSSTDDRTGRRPWR